MRQRASRTARSVVMAALVAAHEPRWSGLSPPGFVAASERLLLACGIRPRRIASLRRPGYRRFALGMERRLVPGQYLHILLRKRFVEEEVETAIAAGIRQVLVVGAGLDSLSLRLGPRHPDVRIVEVDHPATQELRGRALAVVGRPANLTLLPADLRQVKLGEALAALPQWRMEAPAVIVSEGVLMYLEETDVVRFLEGARAVAGAGSRLLFSWVRRRPDGQFDFGPVTRLAVFLHRLGGEPFLWGVRDGELGPFLAAHGFALEEPAEGHDLRRRYLDPAGIPFDTLLARLERLALARRI